MANGLARLREPFLSITAMTVTINVAQTTGVTFNSRSNGFPGDA